MTEKRGTIKWWNRKHGMGFAIVDGESEDVLVIPSSFDGYQNFEKEDPIITEVVDN